MNIEFYIFLLVVGLTIFFISKWVFKKLFGFDRTPVIKIVSAIIGLFSVLIFSYGYQHGKPFDKEEWMKDKQKRYPMATTIIKSKMLMGMDTNQIRFLLGYPARRTDSTYQPGFRNSWVYDLGGGTAGLGFAWHFLIVKFDKTRVVSVDRGMQTD